MAIRLVGISHKTAAIEIREKYYLSQIQQDLYLSELKNDPDIVEAVVLSTCNRTEIYVNSINDRFDAARLVELISHVKKNEFEPHQLSCFYQHKNDSALTHLLRVVSGLDSLVIGEKQILGQVRDAFQKAQERGMLGKQFHILENVVLQAGKKAQTETDISCGGSSVSWAAVLTAERVLGDLADRSILIIGAGKMSELAVGHISKHGFKKLYLMNRTPCNADSLVDKYGGEFVNFCDIKEVLAKVDICFCATDAPHYVIEYEGIEKVLPLRQGRKLVLIDISMPRNIDPRISGLTGIELFHIDELNKPIEENLKKRHNAVADVEKILAEKLAAFHQKIAKIKELNPLGFQETITNL